MAFSKAFGEGFDQMPGFKDGQFDNLADRRGDPIIVVKLISNGEDSYSNPIFSEQKVSTKSFAKQLRSNGRQLMPGVLEEAEIMFLLKLNIAVRETGYEITYMGRRFRIIGVDWKDSHIEVSARRKSDG